MPPIQPLLPGSSPTLAASAALTRRWKPAADLLRLLPSQCMVCRSWPSEPVCQPCQTRFAQPVARCSRCALPMPIPVPVPAACSLSALSLQGGQGIELAQEKPPIPDPTLVQAALVCAVCRRQPPPLDRVVAAVAYAFPWSSLMGQFKFGNSPGMARIFAALLLQTEGVLPLLTALEKGDWLLPLPLSSERLRQRGFNQSWEIARQLAALAPSRSISAGLDAGLLLRVRHSQPQHALPRASRLANVQHAYAVEPLRISALQGRRVVLVDDVMTTGASLHAAAAALRQAGAVHITALVVARTAPHD